MKVCRGCFQTSQATGFDAAGYCPECSANRSAMRERFAAEAPAVPTLPRTSAQPSSDYRTRADRIVMTTETALDVTVVRRVGIVAAEAVVGINLLKDLATDVRDLVGGRSKIAQSSMAEIRQALFAELREQAAKKRADHIIGVSISFSDYGARGSAILAHAIGTAVVTSIAQTQDGADGG